MEPEIQLPWVLLRSTVSSADDDLASSTAPNKTWATFISTYHPESGSSAIAKRLTRHHKYVSICYDHASGTGQTAATVLYAYREGGPAELVYSIDTLTSGTQVSDLDRSSTARYFCDEIGTITQSWPTSSSAVTEANATGSNGVAKVDFDVRGYKYLLCLFPTVSGSARAWFTGIS